MKSNPPCFSFFKSSLFIPFGLKLITVVLCLKLEKDCFVYLPCEENLPTLNMKLRATGLGSTESEKYKS